MKKVAGDYLCALCGERLGIDAHSKPRVVIETQSRKRRVRVLMLDGEEIHRCEIAGK